MRRALAGAPRARCSKPLLGDDEPPVRRMALAFAEAVNATELGADVKRLLDREPNPQVQELGRRVAFQFGADVSVPGTTVEEAGDG